MTDRCLNRQNAVWFGLSVNELAEDIVLDPVSICGRVVDQVTNISLGSLCGFLCTVMYILRGQCDAR